MIRHPEGQLRGEVQASCAQLSETLRSVPCKVDPERPLA